MQRYSGDILFEISALRVVYVSFVTCIQLVIGRIPEAWVFLNSDPFPLYGFVLRALILLRYFLCVAACINIFMNAIICS